MHDEVTPISAVTTCARCDHPFVNQPDGFVDADLENEIAAHQERCFVRGEYVRWDWNGEWIEGNARGSENGITNVEVLKSTHVEDVGCVMSMLTQNVRRIPRPGQEVAPADASDMQRAADEHPAASIEPTLYDGLTAEQCLEQYARLQREDVDADVPREIYPNALTPPQLAAARELWSLQLRAKIAASREAERLTVRIDSMEDE